MFRAGMVPAMLVALTLAAPPARGQVLPSRPVTFADGRVIVAGDIQASISRHDEEAWFNYTDYEYDALRIFRWSVSGEWRLAPRLAVLAETRGENTDYPRLSAAYLRARPFARLPLDVQAGRIPPTFGAFGRRLYSTDNPLIGYPLAYQYVLSIRSDAIPADTRELLRMRARGWLSSFSIGSPAAHPGLPVFNGFHWDTGVQVRLGTDRLQGALAVTNGSLSEPLVSDNNGGKQLAARVQVQPLFGLVLGLSGARGAWLDRDVAARVRGGDDARQQALGFDAEYSRGHWILRGEAIRSAWDMPGLGPSGGPLNLVATGGWIEGRYRLTPRVYIAGRADRLTFSHIPSGIEHVSVPWEAPLTRLETGVGVYLQRNVVTRLSVQHNVRDDGRVRERTYVATQVIYWF